MKTRQRNGLIFYSSKRLNDSKVGVFCIEMVNGHIRYVFGVMADSYRSHRKSGASLRGESLRALTDHLDSGLDDGHWHDVSVQRPLLGEHVLRVDGDVVQLFVEPLTHEFVRKASSSRREYTRVSRLRQIHRRHLATNVAGQLSNVVRKQQS